MKSEEKYLAQGRVDQKLRTRQRVLEAAAHLLSRGQTPTVTEAADHAEVSRRTAYRYFRSQELLLAEAALVLARRPIQQIDLPNEPEERLETTLRSVQDYVYDNEAALRLLAQQSMQHPLATKAGSNEPPRVNRVRFILTALERVRDRLSAADYDRLVSALTLCMGIEAAMTLRYLRNLSPKQATDICSWAAQQILRGALADAKRK